MLPDFKPLLREDRPHLEPFIARFLPYSDFNFTSLFCWNTRGGVTYTTLNGNLVIRFTDYLTGRPFYAFLGDTRADETAHALLSHMEAEGLHPELKLVPEVITAGIQSSTLVTCEDPDNADYILSVPELMTFTGSACKTHRNAVTRFLKSHRPFTRTLNLADPGTQEALRACFLDWIKRKGLPTSQTEQEWNAFLRIFHLAEDGHLHALGVFVQDALAGFAVYERLDGPYGMIHFEKADPSRFIGIYSFIMQETAKALAALGCTLVNYQQDLGLPGLRQGKTSFHPCAYLRKHRIAWKPGATVLN